MLQAIGITKSGIHSVGLVKLSNQVFPSPTNNAPSPATIKIDTIKTISSKIDFFFDFIFIFYSIKNFIFKQVVIRHLKK